MNITTLLRPFAARVPAAYKALACISPWFAKKCGTATGIVVTGSSVGGIIFPIMISRLTKSKGYP
ncbi:hypothetical protein PG993_006435 [Apiospora rasikravindrae]|uniref:Uncharacterized protein n=1 Tax=Apiospora rasikravindrae TaxID=990691 RepID=A0ABR1T5P7_9PEZI